MTDARELAWASGLFDGEGYFGKGTSPTDTLRCRPWIRAGLSMTDEDSVHRFRAAVGVGGVSGPLSNGQHKPYWLWQVHSFEKVQAVIAVLWYGLSGRRKQRAGEVLAFGQTIEIPHGRQTHCPHGHPYDEENTHVYRGRRSCKTCRRTIERNRYHANLDEYRERNRIRMRAARAAAREATVA